MQPIEAEYLCRGRLSFQLMASPVGERGRPRYQGIDSLLGEKDGVAGGLGQLLDTGSNVHRIADQRELQLAATADRPCDHHTGIDPNTDPQHATKPLPDHAVNHHRDAHRTSA